EGSMFFAFLVWALGLVFVAHFAFHAVSCRSFLMLGLRDATQRDSRSAGRQILVHAASLRYKARCTAPRWLQRRSRNRTRTNDICAADEEPPRIELARNAQSAAGGTLFPGIVPLRLQSWMARTGVARR